MHVFLKMLPYLANIALATTTGITQLKNRISVLTISLSVLSATHFSREYSLHLTFYTILNYVRSLEYYVFCTLYILYILCVFDANIEIGISWT